MFYFALTDAFCSCALVDMFAVKQCSITRCRLYLLHHSIPVPRQHSAPAVATFSNTLFLARTHATAGKDNQHVRADVAKHVYIRIGTTIMLIDISIYICVFHSFFFGSTNCADAWRALFSYVF